MKKIGEYERKGSSIYLNLISRYTQRYSFSQQINYSPSLNKIKPNIRNSRSTASLNINITLNISSFLKLRFYLEVNKRISATKTNKKQPKHVSFLFRQRFSFEQSLALTSDQMYFLYERKVLKFVFPAENVRVCVSMRGCVVKLTHTLSGTGVN